VPLIAVPIRTETVIRRHPTVNILLIALNVFLFILFDERITGTLFTSFKQDHLYLRSYEPLFYQFFTYQFLHGDLAHLLSNMLFLWVFGNSVNSKMGNGPYFLFYLAGGVFAGYGYATVNRELSQLLGASGAISAVTTAYLALFPRSRVTILIWFFVFIQFMEFPAMVIIGLKIIVWDNIIGPGLLKGSENVAHSAHLAGYLFGFVGALSLLLIRALPRDQFDILALWSRWNRRRQIAEALSRPDAPAWGRMGTVGRADSADGRAREIEEHHVDEIAQIRERITLCLERQETALAAELYESLLLKNPQQCLSERDQLQVVRELYRTEKFVQAAAACGRFVECYPHSSEAANVRLLLGIICARDLREYELADKHLSESIRTLRDETRREQCLQWLRNVRAVLGRPEPGAAGT